jgi:hypothetical protein
LKINPHLTEPLARNRLWILLIFLITASVACFAIYNIAEVRGNIAYTVKHGAICFLQNHSIIKNRHAHYTPDQGTVDIVYCSPEKDPIFSGEQMDHSIFVLSDFGHQIQRINRLGQIVWRQNLHIPRGLESTKKYLYVGDGKELLIIDVDTGTILKRHRYSRHITALKVYDNKLFVAFDSGKFGTIIGYLIDSRMNKILYRLPVRLASARGFDISNNVLIIADTFNHRIIKIILNSNNILSVRSYYPNSVQILKNEVLVSEEHLNTVSKFSFDNLNKYGAKAGCFDTKKSDPQIEKNVFNEMHVLGMLCNSIDRRNILYSPNDAIYDNGSLYIADTDNHRILVLKNGLIQSTISGFNNPVNIRLVK